MEPFELALLAMAAVQLLFVATVLWVRREGTRTTRFASLLPIALFAYIFTSAPDAGTIAAWLVLPLTVLCMANSSWFWLLGEALFADDLRIELRWFVPALVIIAAGVWHEVALAETAARFAYVVFQLGILAGVAATVCMVLRGKRGDLFRPRRGWRIGAAVPDAALADSEPATASEPKRAHAALAARIQQAMQVEHLFRRESLTVADLAHAIGSREYLVRRAINGNLGYRNFNEFLHTFRLGEASQRLLSQPERPILTIALDVGYGLIGPFNRAFRARFGMTPSDRRGLPRQQPSMSTHL